MGLKKGDSHINTAENRFSFVKAWYRRFRGLSRKHLNLWINLLEPITEHKERHPTVNPTSTKHTRKLLM